VDVVGFINLALKMMTISGLLAGLFFIAVQILISRMERKEHRPRQR
jgi:hypothetical protein